MDDGLRGKELEEAYWFNTHRQQLVSLAYGIAWAFVGLIWLVVLYQLFVYITHIGATNRATSDLTNTQVVYDSIQAPTSLQIKDVLSLENGTNRVDVYGLIHNPNAHHVGRFSYTVTLNGNPFQFHDGIINPEGDAHLAIFGGTGTRLSSAGITIDDIAWQRTKGPTPNYEFKINDLVLGTTDLADNSIRLQTNTNPTNTNSTNTNGNANNTENENLNTNSNANVNANTNINSEGLVEETDDEAGVLENETKQFATPTTGANTSVAVGETVSQVTANIFSNSPYGFKRAVATVVVKGTDGAIVGVQQVVLSNVKAFSDTPVRFIWSRRFEFNSTAELFVDTDVWDEANLILPGE